ncbi:hypothetical protein G6F56_004644 [Rhizopus delemar]|nr:hypothetical protein G6F56_004644 [Rhizopus delemar]
MHTVYHNPLNSPTALTPSTIQCLHFYSNDQKGVANQLKKLNQSFRRVPKSISLPILETVKKPPPSLPYADFPYASISLRLSGRYPQTIPCLDLELAQNVRIM